MHRISKPSGFKSPDSDNLGKQATHTVSPRTHPWLTSVKPDGKVSGFYTRFGLSLPDPSSRASLLRGTSSGWTRTANRPHPQPDSRMHATPATTTSNQTTDSTDRGIIFSNHPTTEDGAGVRGTPALDGERLSAEDYGTSPRFRTGGGQTPPSPASLHSVGDGWMQTIHPLHPTGTASTAGWSA